MTRFTPTLTPCPTPPAIKVSAARKEAAQLTSSLEETKPRIMQLQTELLGQRAGNKKLTEQLLTLQDKATMAERLLADSKFLRGEVCARHMLTRLTVCLTMWHTCCQLQLCNMISNGVVSLKHAIGGMSLISSTLVRVLCGRVESWAGRVLYHLRYQHVQSKIKRS